jgi:hypothetical protein
MAAVAFVFQFRAVVKQRLDEVKLQRTRRGICRRYIQIRLRLGPLTHWYTTLWNEDVHDSYITISHGYRLPIVRKVYQNIN